MTQEEAEEDLEMLVAPALRLLRQEEMEGCRERSGEGEDDHRIEGAGQTPVAGRTRSRQTGLRAPLRQAVGNDGPITVKVPFSISDLNNWKIAAGNY